MITFKELIESIKPKVDKSNPPKGIKTLIVNINGCKLFRLDPDGNWNGDFWYELKNGESGFIDPSLYERGDQKRLENDFKRDYKTDKFL